MALPTVAQRVEHAVAAIGKQQNVGYCETFTRGHFGFPAKYATAYKAYLASKARGGFHTDKNPPAGVPVFWDIKTGSNAGADHIAMSVGGGYVVSTSAGPGRTVAKVKITDLERAWANVGLTYRGWGEWYHDVRVHTAPKPPSGGSAAVRTWQTRQNTHGHAGLFVDGVKGTYSKAWESWVKNHAQHYLDFYAGVQDKVVKDGDYGPSFAAQVRVVQQRNGLFVDGILGPVMIAWMRKQGSTGLASRPKTRP